MQTQCSDWNTELDHNANVTPMTGWRQLKPAALFKVHFVAWLILRLCWAEPQIHFLHAGLSGSEDNSPGLLF